MIKKSEMQLAVDEIKGYYRQWLKASELTEESFLKNRTCQKFQLQINEWNINGMDGIGVSLVKENGVMIGQPFFIGYENTKGEKEQYFVNTPLLIHYMAVLLDQENEKNPINGSYPGTYFKDKVKRFLPKLMDIRVEMLGKE